MPRSETIAIRVTPETLQAIDAARGGMSRARWVGELIAAELNRDPAAAGTVELNTGTATTGNASVKIEVCTHPRARVIKGFCYRCGSMVLPK